MRQLIIVLGAILCFCFTVNSQINDTIPAKVISVSNLQVCLLVKVVSLCNNKDTTVLISPLNNDQTDQGTKIEIGQSYIFAVEKEVIVASPTRKMKALFRNTIIWTSNEPYKLKPRECYNCFGEYIK